MTNLSDYDYKTYPRSTISVGNKSSSEFILTNVIRSIKNAQTIHGYHNEYYIEKKGFEIQPYIFSGLLYDTDLTRWEDEFIYNYNHYWKASVCLKKGKQVTVKFKNIVVKGYIVELSVVSRNTGISEFQFRMILSDRDKLLSGYSSIDINDRVIDYPARKDIKARISIGPIVPDSTDEEFKNYIDQSFQEFILRQITKTYREKYQVYNGINSFGSHPITYLFQLSLLNTPDIKEIDIIKYSWDEAFRKYMKESWDFDNLSRNTLIQIFYKNKMVSGYLLDPNEILKAQQNWSDFSFSLLVVREQTIGPVVIS